MTTAIISLNFLPITKGLMKKKHNETQYTLAPLNIMWHLTTKNKVILNHCSQKLSENTPEFPANHKRINEEKP